jgi:hypothetical protein
MTDLSENEEIDWDLCTWKGSRRRQYKEFHALPFSRKLEIIEEMNALANPRQKKAARDGTTSPTGGKSGATGR